MDKTPPNLLGFAGRLLRQPPLAHGVALSFFQLLWLCATIIIGGLPAFIVYSFGFERAGLFALGWWIVYGLYAGKFGTFALHAWKFRFVIPRFWIVALRPFHDDSASYLFRHVVAPTLGCYGAINVFSDESFARSERKVNDMNVDYQVLGDALLAMKAANEKWRPEVLSTIILSDLAVIDLTLPSANLLWETACCVQLLPPHRILLIGVKGISWHPILELVREYLAKCLPDEALPVNLPSPISYGGFLFGRWRFRRKIFGAMRAIERLDRETAAGGSWYLPKYLQYAADAKLRDALRRENPT